MASRARGLVLPLAGILLLAINLRPTITAVGPVITEVGSDLSLSASELGLLGALPILVFGLVSSFVQILIARFGVERVAAGALITLTLATVLRSWPGPNANLWVGTVLIGVAIAVGNVAVPVFVKREFPSRTAGITGIYTAVLGVCAGLAAALAVPISQASVLGWRLALGVWAILTIIAAAYWVRESLRVSAVSGGKSVPLGEGGRSLWRSPVAWQLSVYTGVQSAVFYIALTWLPTVEQHLGYSAVVAGWHMFILQVAGVVGNLVAPVLMRVGSDQRFAAVTPGLMAGGATIGMFLAPGAALLWVIVLGLGTGSSFVVALSLMAQRASSLQAAGQLSAMSQGVGYIIAGVLLFVAGLIAGVQVLGVIVVLLLATAATATMGLFSGRLRMV